MSGPAALELTPAEKRMIDARKQAIHDAKAKAIANGNPHAADGGLPYESLDGILEPTSEDGRKRLASREATKLESDRRRPSPAGSKPHGEPPRALRPLLAWVADHPGPVNLDDLADHLKITPKSARGRWDWAKREGLLPRDAEIVCKRPGRLPGASRGPRQLDAPRPAIVPPVDQVEVETRVPDSSPVAAIAAAPNKFDLALRVLGQLTDADHQTAVEVLSFARRALELMRPS